MKTKLTRIHLGLGMNEIGVQFEATGDDGVATTQRAFLAVDDASLASVWIAAQTALAAKLAELPMDLPPGAVTSALMRQRAAEAAAQEAVDVLRAVQKETERAESGLAEVTAMRDAVVADLELAIAERAAVQVESDAADK